MNVFNAAGSGLLDRLGASRNALSARPGSTAGQAGQGNPLAAANGSAALAAAARSATRVSLEGPAANDLVYTHPATRLSVQRAWAGASDNDVSALMLRNSGRDATSLADRWRGLGGALLSQLAATGTGYQQALAEYIAPVEDTAGVADAASAAGTDNAAAAAALQRDALAGIGTQATELSLQLRTRSGQTVELKLTVNDGLTGGTRGLKAEISSSGSLNAAERDALEHLAGGLDQALDGLGQQPPQLDLSRLINFDRSQFASLDLQVKDPNTSTVPGQLQAFSLHLGDDKKALSLRTPDSELQVEVEATEPAVGSSIQQRWSAIDSLMKQIDAAAERSHAGDQVVDTFKSALRQFQAPAVPDTGAAPGAIAGPAAATASVPMSSPLGSPLSPSLSPPLSTELQEQLAPLQSGLADFQASFSGTAEKTTRYGGVKERSETDYRISQDTQLQRDDTTGATTLTQTRQETLDATVRRAREGLLDNGRGDEDVTRIRDQQTVTTLVDTLKDAVTRALRRTDEQRSSTVTTLENHRVADRRGTPQERHEVQRLR